MKSAKFVLGSCVSAIALLSAIPVHLSAAEIPTVVVTAQKRSQSVQDVSAAVTAVGANRLAGAHINNIEDLQVIVPNIYLGNDFNMAKTFIRGVGANTSTTGSETGVAMHVDGAFVARAEAQLTSLFDLDRVEVLRGPQGTLYGRNAVGGSINLITAKPTREFEGYIRSTVANYHSFVGEGAISGPLTDTLLARLAVKSENRHGFGTNPVTHNDVDDLDRQMARAHLWFVPSDTFDVLLSGEYYKQNDASRAVKFLRVSYPGVSRLAAFGVGGYASDPRDLASDYDPGSETETWAITGTANWHLNENFTLTNITNYREIEGFLLQDLDVSAVINSAAANNQNSTIQRRDIKSQQISTEQQFKYVSDWFNGVLGVFYFQEDQYPVDTVGAGPVLGESNILATLASPGVAPHPGPPSAVTGVQVDGVNNVAIASIPLAQALDLCNTYKYLDASTPGLIPKRVCIKTHLSNESWAVFGQGTINLGVLAEPLKPFSIKLGGRYSEEEVTSSNPSIVVARNGLGPVLLTTSAGSFNSRIFSNFSPEAGLEWRPTSDLMLYYTYSKGFKAGAGENNQGPVTAAVNFRSIIVNPEKIVNHEAGLKSEWFDNRLIVNVAGFTYELTDQQINKTVPGGPAGFSTIFQNAAKTSARGVEVEATAFLSEDLRVSGSLNWLDSKYTDFLTLDPLVAQNIATPATCPVADPTITWPTSCVGFTPDPNAGPNLQLAGNPTRNSPRWAGNVHIEYDLSGLQLPGDGLITFMTDVTYKSDVFFTEFYRLLEGQEAVTLVDFNLHFATGDRRFKADVWVKNATDELVRSSTFALATARTLGVTYMPPRTYGLTMSYNF